jgi:hypothetical protein
MDQASFPADLLKYDQEDGGEVIKNGKFTMDN